MVKYFGNLNGCGKELRKGNEKRESVIIDRERERMRRDVGNRIRYGNVGGGSG